MNFLKKLKKGALRVAKSAVLGPSFVVNARCFQWKCFTTNDGAIRSLSGKFRPRIFIQTHMYLQANEEEEPTKLPS